MSAFTWSALVVAVAGAGGVTSALAQKAEVIHWWTSGGESAAVKQLAEAYNLALDTRQFSLFDTASEQRL